jgi:hypothetical protein
MKNIAATFVLTALCLACAAETPPVPEERAGAAEASAGDHSMPTDRIAIAMSGAPTAVASAATIMDFDASGNLVELRPGTNGWMCIADDTPAAPGESPDCLDQRWQEWFDAYMKGEVPKISGIGLAYMLQGSLSPSNTDPLAQTPPPGQTWMEDGPHVMLIVPDPAMLNGFPSEHGTGGPYVMYRGTPYAHLMVPIGSH